MTQRIVACKATGIRTKGLPALLDELSLLRAIGRPLTGLSCRTVGRLCVASITVMLGVELCAIRPCLSLAVGEVCIIWFDAIVAAISVLIERAADAVRSDKHQQRDLEQPSAPHGDGPWSNELAVSTTSGSSTM